MACYHIQQARFGKTFDIITMHDAWLDFPVKAKLVIASHVSYITSFPFCVLGVDYVLK